MKVKIPNLIMLKQLYSDVSNKLSIEYGYKHNLDSWQTIYRIVIEEVNGERVYILRKMRDGKELSGTVFKPTDAGLSELQITCLNLEPDLPIERYMGFSRIYMRERNTATTYSLRKKK